MKNPKKDREKELLTELEKQYLEIFSTMNPAVPSPPLSLIQPPAYTYIPSLLTFGTEDKPLVGIVH